MISTINNVFKSTLFITARKIMILVFSMLLSSYSHAIAIDRLFAVADENGQAVYTVTNTLDYRIYLAVTFEEMEMVDGSSTLKKTYTRDNIDEWQVIAKPARIIIEPGFEKQFTVEMVCGGNCDHDKEQVFRVKTLPMPYFESLKEYEESSGGQTAFSIGFVTRFLNPTEDSPIDLAAYYSQGSMRLKNNGESFVYVSLDWCTPEQQTNKDQSCKKTRRVFSKQEQVYRFESDIDLKNLRVTAHTLKRKYKKEIEFQVE